MGEREREREKGEGKGFAQEAFQRKGAIYMSFAFD
jgi:hypothetical protein